MVASQRRRSATAAARLILITGLGGLALVWVWNRTLGRELDVRASAVSESGAVAAAPAVAADSSAGNRATLAPQSSVDAARSRGREPALEARVRATIAEWEQKASEITKGRCAPSEVSVAVSVRELVGDREIVAIGADRVQRPASNLKLATSAAALVLLGTDWNFETVFASSAMIAAGELQGDLVVHAGGDPLYDPAAGGGVDAFFAPVYASLARHGVKRISGALVLDEGSYQEPTPGPAWPAENQHWSEFCALAGGFSANAGCLTASVRPGPAAGAASVRVAPQHHGLAQKFDVRTGAAKSRLDVRLEARNGIVRVEGSIPKSVDVWSDRFAAPDPVELFGNVLLGELREHGIVVAGGVRRERGRRDAGARALARIRTPLLSTLVPINTHSNNACADQLFLATGAAIEGLGTRSGGRAATLRALARLDVSTHGFVQVDGSGLSRDNRVSARQITALVAAVLRGDERTARAFHDSLAVGAESGTLDDRLKELEGRVHAKTGFIGGTSALSGTLDAFDGRRLVFSILVEYPTMDGLNTRCWKKMQDEICLELARSRG